MAENKSCAFRTSIGGQALIEGILMRGPERQAIVVRDQEGRLVEKTEELRFIRDRYPILGVPLILILPLFIGIDGILFAGPIADTVAFVTTVLLIRREMKHIRRLEQQAA